MDFTEAPDPESANEKVYPPQPQPKNGRVHPVLRRLLRNTHLRCACQVRVGGVVRREKAPKCQIVAALSSVHDSSQCARTLLKRVGLLQAVTVKARPFLSLLCLSVCLYFSLFCVRSRTHTHTHTHTPSSQYPSHLQHAFDYPIRS